MSTNVLPTLLGDGAALAPRIRDQIVALEQAMGAVPGAVFGDTALCPLTHHFADGVYIREIFIPKGTLVVGKVHRYRHYNVLLQGHVIVLTEQGGREEIVAPCSLISEPGTKRAVYAIEDTLWQTVHANPHELRDLAALEAEIICPSFAAYEAHRAAREGETP
jgi:quercetin dioxygenase-like cupin family protein